MTLYSKDSQKSVTTFNFHILFSCVQIIQSWYWNHGIFGSLPQIREFKKMKIGNDHAPEEMWTVFVFVCVLFINIAI